MGAHQTREVTRERDLLPPGRPVLQRVRHLASRLRQVKDIFATGGLTEAALAKRPGAYRNKTAYGNPTLEGPLCDFEDRAFLCSAPSLSRAAPHSSVRDAGCPGTIYRYQGRQPHRDRSY